MLIWLKIKTKLLRRRELKSQKGGIWGSLHAGKREPGIRTVQRGETTPRADAAAAFPDAEAARFAGGFSSAEGVAERWVRAAWAAWLAARGMVPGHRWSHDPSKQPRTLKELPESQLHVSDTGVRWRRLISSSWQETGAPQPRRRLLPRWLHDAGRVGQAPLHRREEGDGLGNDINPPWPPTPVLSRSDGARPLAASAEESGGPVLGSGCGQGTAAVGASASAGRICLDLCAEKGGCHAPAPRGVGGGVSSGGG